MSALVPSLIMGTIDIKIQNRCDHTIVGERLTLQDDFVTFLPTFPIASSTSIFLDRFGLDVSSFSYDLVLTNNVLYDNKYYRIVLKRPELYLNPLYEISYTTTSEFCPKCMGANFVDDIVFGNTGNVVTEAPQLIQMVEKFLVTTKGTNKYNPWVGSGLTTLIGTKITDFDALATEIKAMVRSCLTTLNNVQLKYQGVNSAVSPEEVILNIETIDVTQNEQDPSIVYVYVQYTSQGGSVYDFTQVLDLTNYRVRL